MLPEQDRELLTAYVDGELSTRQRKTVLRLLRRSTEARELLRQLQQDARELRELPRPRLNPDFSQRVLHNIGQRGLRPPRRPDRAAVPFWTLVAAAASVLCAVGLGTFAFVVTRLASDDQPSRVAGKKPDRTPSPAISKDAPPSPGKEGVAKGRPEEGPSKGRTDVKEGPSAEPVVKTPDKKTEPIGREKSSEGTSVERLPTAPPVEQVDPAEVHVCVPSLFRLRAIAPEREGGRLRKDLARDEA